MTASWAPLYAHRGAGVWNPDGRRPEAEFVKAAQEAGITIWRQACDVGWKDTVGPVAQRPHCQFGLPEFLAWCQATNAAPILIVPVYNLGWVKDAPRDADFMAAYAADLVEYLNSPNDGRNPNGGTDWAAVRAADGHPKPYDVLWFEGGNEGYASAGEWIEHLKVDGYGGLVREYAARFLRIRAAVKAVDPRVQLGANIQYPIDPWNKGLLQVAGKDIDFGICHVYWPGGTGDQRGTAQACVASGGHYQEIYDYLNRLVAREIGRTDIPWAITEQNISHTGDAPVPYRDTLGNALNLAEHIRVMMQPSNRVALATYWNFANEAWGMVRGFPHHGQPLLRQPPFYAFQLYSQHFGDTLIAVRVSCGHWEFPGAVYPGGVNLPRQDVPDLTVNAAKRQDGTITLMIVNTNLDEDSPTALVAAGRRARDGSRAAAWSLVGTTPWATNLGPQPEVQVVATPIQESADGWQITLPKYSLTAVELPP